jgi:hypothetical protein
MEFLGPLVNNGTALSSNFCLNEDGFNGRHDANECIRYKTSYSEPENTKE